MAYPLPSWLQVSPDQFLAAVNSGAQAGLHVAGLRNQAQQSADRLAEAANEASANRAAAADRASEQIALHSWEAGERLRQQAKELADLSAYREGQLGNRAAQLSLQAADESRKESESRSKHDYYTGKLKNETEKLDRRQLIKSGSDLLEYDPTTGEATLIYKGTPKPSNDPTQYQKITEKLEARKFKPSKPAWGGIFGIGAHGSIPEQPEQLPGTLTRTIRVGAPTDPTLSTNSAPTVISSKRIRVRHPDGTLGTISDDPNTIAAAKEAKYEFLQ